MTWKCGEIRTVRRTGVWASISSDWLLHCSTDLGKQGVCCGDCFPPCLFLSESGEPPTPTVWTMQLSHINSCRYFPLFVMVAYADFREVLPSPLYSCFVGHKLARPVHESSSLDKSEKEISSTASTQGNRITSGGG
ncbi:hypothetical protein, conserved [Trypanosoma brucei gambiense DAL972]|uniref:Uncharacterized protein n=1 Tax=Trypanosoma brucei gambiense (strain MHOM/CI/86/DAL972) TaxID=679716 RepID=C9ZW06_TRYB9|nr:hypothetical protein, conserved [Trypanosoma brucei gambiense DAL972]CBH13594.1 hypothetical protein, conserved [Trypanosoma brucei gambiense DAL972]|eukprot:XP_011775871.1 hypothetical protein, conserved [Trypanosoma brucei gambiense DAL972]